MLSPTDTQLILGGLPRSTSETKKTPPKTQSAFASHTLVSGNVVPYAQGAATRRNANHQPGRSSIRACSLLLLDRRERLLLLRLPASVCGRSIPLSPSDLKEQLGCSGSILCDAHIFYRRFNKPTSADEKSVLSFRIRSAGRARSTKTPGKKRHT
jgi:hypothetical protein